MTQRFLLNQECSDNKRTDLLRENSILELISSGAPLPDVLNKLCTAVDLQIGNVVSVILPAAKTENDLQTLASNAVRFGLHVFWAAKIPLWDDDFLATFGVYCCDSRRPTPLELQLIHRVTDLAGVAIRRRQVEEKLERSYRDWEASLRSPSNEAPRLN